MKKHAEDNYGLSKSFWGLVLLVSLFLQPNSVFAKTYRVRIYTQNTSQMTPTVQNIRIALYGSNGKTHSQVLCPTHGTASGAYQNHGIKPYQMHKATIFFTKDNWYDYHVPGVPDLGHVIKIAMKAVKNTNAGSRERLYIQKVSVLTGSGSNKLKWHFNENGNMVLKLGDKYQPALVDGWAQTSPKTITETTIEHINPHVADNLKGKDKIDLGLVSWTHVDSSNVTNSTTVEADKEVHMSIKGTYGSKFKNITAEVGGSIKEKIINSVEKSKYAMDQYSRDVRIVANPEEYRIFLEVIRHNTARGTFNAKMEYYKADKPRTEEIPIEYDLNYGIARQVYNLRFDKIPTGQEIANQPNLGKDQALKEYIKANWGN